MPIGLSRLIQVGLPTMTFASMAGLLVEPAGARRSATRSSSASRSASSPRSRRGTTRCTRSRPRSRRRSPRAAPSCSSRPSYAAVRVRVRGDLRRGRAARGRVEPRHRPRAGRRGSAISHPGVDFVTFTGSEGVGRHIGEVTGRNLVPVGARARRQVGLHRARRRRPASWQSRRVSPAACSTAGQTCIALSRCSSRASGSPRPRRSPPRSRRRYTLGDPFDAATKMGPLVSAAQRDRVREHIRARHRRGCAAGDRRRRAPLRASSAATSLPRRSSPPFAATWRSPRRRSSARSLDPRLRRRGGRDPDRQRLALRALGCGLVGRRGPRAAGGAPHPHRPGRCQRRRVQPARPVRRRRPPARTRTRRPRPDEFFYVKSIQL